MKLERYTRRVVILFLGWAAGMAVLAGCTSGPQFSFEVTADCRKFTPPEHPGPAYFAGVCEAIRALGPGAFMISPGDIDPPDRTGATIRAVLGENYAWYPVVGNHELDKPEYMTWLRAYNSGGTALPHIVRGGPPGAVETCYAFDYHNAHFVVINQYYDGQRDDVKGGDVSDALYDWLALDLAANRKPLVFVAGHEPHMPMPDFDNGRVRHRGDSLDAHEDHNHRFWTLLRQHGVTAYFCGHTHCASIAKINGVWQIDAGHARGKGDEGAASSFVRLHVAGQSVRCELYRSDRPGEKPYTLTYTEQLRCSSSSS